MSGSPRGPRTLPTEGSTSAGVSVRSRAIFTTSGPGRRRMNGRRRNVVFTALVGGYETLTEQPVAAESDFEFVCFTDDAELSSETWQIHPERALDEVRARRAREHARQLSRDEEDARPRPREHLV